MLPRPCPFLLSRPPPPPPPASTPPYTPYSPPPCQELADVYPEVYRFGASVFPSEDDDVITSPYNALLATAALAEHADCVFPVENQALMDICSRVDEGARRAATKVRPLMVAGHSGCWLRVSGGEPGADGHMQPRG